MRKFLLSLLSVLLALPALADDSSKTVDLSFTKAKIAELYTVTKEGANSTGGELAFSVKGGDLAFTSNSGYLNAGSNYLKVYKGGKFNVSLAPGLEGVITSIKFTYSSECYPFAEAANPGNNGKSKTPSSGTTVVTYTVPNGGASTVSFSNVAGGKTEIRNMVIVYTATGTPTGTTEPVEPKVTIQSYTYAASITSGYLKYAVTNPVEGTPISAKLIEGTWVSNLAVDEENSRVTFDMAPNTATSGRSAKIELSYGSYAKVVGVVSQKKYIREYASLPLTVAAGTTGSDLKDTDGVTASIESTDYNNADHKIKFAKNTHYIMVKTDQPIGYCEFDFRGCTSNGKSTFELLGSEDGKTWSLVETFTVSFAKKDDCVQVGTTEDFDRSFRYLKLAFKKLDGEVNCGLGEFTINPNTSLDTTILKEEIAKAKEILDNAAGYIGVNVFMYGQGAYDKLSKAIADTEKKVKAVQTELEMYEVIDQLRKAIREFKPIFRGVNADYAIKHVESGLYLHIDEDGVSLAKEPTPINFHNILLEPQMYIDQYESDGFLTVHSTYLYNTPERKYLGAAWEEVQDESSEDSWTDLVLKNDKLDQWFIIVNDDNRYAILTREEYKTENGTSYEYQSLYAYPVCDEDTGELITYEPYVWFTYLDPFEWFIEDYVAPTFDVPAEKEGEYAEEATSIANASAKVAPVAYYTANGAQLKSAQKGLNIVKMSDNSVRKIFVK